MPACHDQTFALARALQARGLTLPWSGRAPDEALLLGLGGGIGFQAFTFQYQGMPPVLFLGTRCAHQYAYDAAFLERALAGLGMGARLAETGSARKAAADLDAALQDGPVLAWVGHEALHARPAPAGVTPWVVVVEGRTEGPDGPAYGVHDAHLGPVTLSAPTLAAARAAPKKAKHRLLVPEGRPTDDPGPGIRAGVAWCVDELAGAHAVAGHQGSFGLGALERWARRADDRSKEGWRTVFAPGAPLLAGVRQAWGWLERATGGGAFRPVYAAFLADAAGLLDDPRLAEAADRVRDNGAAWTDLADRLLDPSVPLLAEVRSAVQGAPWPAPPNPRLSDRAAELPAGWAEALYPDLAARLSTLLDGERAAARALAAAR